MVGMFRVVTVWEGMIVLSDVLWALFLFTGFVTFVVGSFFVCDWWAGKRIDELVERGLDRTRLDEDEGW